MGEDGSKPTRVAVFCVHGMGQQMRFETLTQVAEGIRRFLPRTSEGKYSIQGEKATSVMVDGRLRQRYEMTFETEEKPQIDLHLYEGYWAPIPEGKVYLWDVIRFLLSGALNGIRHVSRQGFRRWMFDGWQELRVKPGTFLHILLALFVLGFLLALNLGAVILTSSFFSPTESWFAPLLTAGHMPRYINFVTEVLAWLAIGLTGVGFLMLAMTVRKRMWARLVATEQPLKLLSENRIWTGLAWVVNVLFWIWLISFCLAGIVFLLMLPVWGWAYHDGLSGYLPKGISPSGDSPVFYVIWLPILILTALLRSWLIEYVGDVAAYISPHKLDRFKDIRAEIQGEISKTLRTIYEPKEEYEKIIIMGHSLGSVIAYDALNTLLAEAELKQNCNTIIERTKAFITFGSPLNKVAFMYARRGDSKSEVRGRLAEARQPLIKNYGSFRQIPWINIYALRDIIGAELTFFDGSKETRISSNGLMVDNIVDEDALIPLIAHTEYWDSPILFKKLLDKVWG